MAKYYGDIPCVKLNGIVHITKCATECLCVKNGVIRDLQIEKILKQRI